MVCITGVTVYAEMRPAVFEAPYQLVFLEDDQIAVVEEGQELVEGVNATFVRGSVLMQWDKAKASFPESLQDFFIQPNLPLFGLELAKKLLLIIGWWIFLTLLFYDLGALILRHKTTSAMDFLYGSISSFSSFSFSAIAKRSSDSSILAKT